MKNSNVGTYLLKGIGLLILDIITLLLVFSIWTIVNIPLFPWALIAILFSLIAVNIVILATKMGIQLFGIGTYTSALIATLFYYVFVMIYTGVTYITISSKWYLVVILFITLIYIAVIAGLRISGTNKVQDMEKQGLEQSKVLDVTLQLMTIEENIKKSYSFVEKESYDAMITSFNEMSERLKASTPFGRIRKPGVLHLENQIILKLSLTNDDIILLKTTHDHQKISALITEVFIDIKSLIMNREILIIQ